jgi:hypothetical protein
MTKIQQLISTLAVALLALALIAAAQDPDETPDPPQVVLGVFDSRAISLAYYRSAMWRESLSELREEHEAAKAAGDTDLAEKLEEKGVSTQGLAHRQTFGNAPVRDLVALIEEELPEIAKEAGVDVIVSKWSLAFRNSSAKAVDVTNLLAAQFDPDEETLKIIEQVVETEPVPLEQLENHDH